MNSVKNIFQKYMILIGFVLLLAAFGMFYLFYTGSYATATNQLNTYKAQVAEYDAKIEQLSKYKADEESNKAKTEEIQKQIDQAIAEFPVELKEEDMILYAERIGDDNNMDVSSISFGSESVLYSLDGSMSLCAESLGIDYDTSYSGLKKLIKYIVSEGYPRSSIITMSISYNSDNDEAKGSLSLQAYYVTGQSGGYVPPEITESFGTGVGNIFKTR